MNSILATEPQRIDLFTEFMCANVHIYIIHFEIDTVMMMMMSS